MSISLRMPTRFIIDPLKISGYLLDGAHKTGGSKARFFLGWGFRTEAPLDLAQALVEHALHMPLIRVVSISPWGDRLLFRGPIQSPNGPTPEVLAVWQVAPGSTEAMLVTAYPA